MLQCIFFVDSGIVELVFGVTCQVRVRFEPEQHYLLLYQRGNNSKCFAGLTRDDPEKYVIGIYLQDKI